MMRYLMTLAIAGTLAISVAEQIRPIVLDNFAAVAAALQQAQRR